MGLSVIVHEVYIRHVPAFKPEDNAPIPRHVYGPMALVFALQLVQPVAGQIHVLGPRSRVQAGKYAPQFVRMVRVDLRGAVVFVELF